MIIEPLPLSGLFKLIPQKHTDERGFFTRILDVDIFKKQGLPIVIQQSSLSFNLKKGTLRGLHYQTQPDEEIKIVQCLQGKVFDVVVDLRPLSKTYLKWHSIQLCGEEKTALYIPKGFAHGFLTLTDNTQLLYQMEAFYEPSSSAGIHYADPTLNIEWPDKIMVISEKDENLPVL